MKNSASKNCFKEMTNNPVCENKEQFLKRKSFPSVESSKEVTTKPVFKNKQGPASAFECDLCDTTFKTENHIGL